MTLQDQLRSAPSVWATKPHGFEHHGAAGNVRGQIGDDFGRRKSDEVAICKGPLTMINQYMGESYAICLPGAKIIIW